MQVKYASFADNQLTGGIPVLPNVAVFLNMSSNRLTKGTFSNPPASLQLLYLANNSLTGNLPSAEDLPANLTLLDVSCNRFAGALPSALPPSLAVLNASNNVLTGELPSNWSMTTSLAELRLDHNAFTGKLPATWSAWGKSSQNSLQLSLVNASLHGDVPQQWVQQFCIAIFRAIEPQILFKPVTVKMTSTTMQAGPFLELAAQHASINVSLGGAVYEFSYSSPKSMCGIPNAVRNVALVWGVFAALLVVVIICTHLWLKRAPTAAISGVSAKLTRVTSSFNNKKLHKPKQVTEKIWFFMTNVIYFLYSQVTDVITIHQVFQSGQLRYAFLLLGILLLPYAFTFLLIIRVSVEYCQGKLGNWSSLLIAAAYFVGVLLSPVIYLMVELLLVFHGLGCPLPRWFKSLDVERIPSEVSG